MPGPLPVPFIKVENPRTITEEEFNAMYNAGDVDTSSSESEPPTINDCSGHLHLSESEEDEEGGAVKSELNRTTASSDSGNADGAAQAAERSVGGGHCCPGPRKRRGKSPPPRKSKRKLEHPKKGGK